MANLDDLINNIYADETVPIEGTLDTAAQWRIEERILSNINTAPTILYKKKTHRKKRLVLALVAVLLLALGLTTIAAVQNDWDVILIDFMGISDADTLQLEGGDIFIDKTAQYEKTSPFLEEVDDLGLVDIPIQMTVVSSIGDKNNAYIRIETDYILPDTFNPETDYVLPFDIDTSISPMLNGYGSEFTSFEENGRLGFLLSITNCDKLNKSDITLEIHDLYLYHDLHKEYGAPEEELLCAGTWSVNWKYNYRSNVQNHHMLKTFESNGVTYYLTCVEVSPIAIRMEAFRMPQDRDKALPGPWLEKVQFKDGTTLSIEEESGGGLSNGIFAESYVNVREFGNAIDPETVESITICGKRINLH